MKNKFITLIASACLGLSAVAQDFSKVEIKTHNVAGDVYMLEGYGGNIGVLSTNKGLLLVDDQFQGLAEKIEQAMKEVNDKPLKYVVNTHYHGDHTGSNSYFSHKAPIFAHENVRERLSNKAEPNRDELPVVTYENGVNIYLDNEHVQLRHFPTGHTDGDTVVYFKNANVIHTGDLFFNERFPYIDLKGGGDVKGYLKSVKTIINDYPSDAKIIPGHGNITDIAGYKVFAAMIEYSIERVEKALADGKTEAQILEMGIGEKYKDYSWAFISEERWLKTLVTGLQ
ncbi:MBL fold metallo-hydrolase [Thalassotalea sp. LPB0316]|uniref:MBL fold metallo-hydrolase n=1 Tax=Thalassotalea sp. LPB0316 TaxID=2769490 RepID=UPI00186943BA|nr:MBL fold metallo-hydrolase [Thalassotalea sp. LPB0316]QOL27008.1 MBL fold metallo-hydrolase [Thalassotalea sp. LPB0316]